MAGMGCSSGQRPPIRPPSPSAMSKQRAECKKGKLCPEAAGTRSPGFHIYLCSPGKPLLLGLSPSSAERARLLLLSNESTLLPSLLNNQWGTKGQTGIGGWGAVGRGGSRVAGEALQQVVPQPGLEDRI